MQLNLLDSAPAPMPLSVYCDGASKGNPGLGGWGVVAFEGELEIYSEFGGRPVATNNQMELQAMIQALQWLGTRQGTIITDSKYVLKGLTEWLPGWKRKGWRTAGGEPVKNVEQWKLLDQLKLSSKAKLEWVRGHSGILGNERADDLANEGARRAQSGKSGA